jgi:hypothetical protein
MPSTVIAAIAYDNERRILRVTFVSGLVYEYMEVPEEVYTAFRSSGTKGIFLNREIRNKYTYKKVIA